MRYRLLGNTGLYVSELCLGTMTFGGKGFWEAIGSLGTRDVETLIGTSFDAGVNFLDTADVYSEGESETLVGAALASLGRPRDQVVVATKVRGRTGPGPNQIGLSRGHIMASIDGHCDAWGSITSTFTRSTESTTTHRSRRPCGRSTTWYGRARSATSGSATSPPG
jgi:aryl-alcohol dehydrogenase-like predicted oxidoreductase